MVGKSGYFEISSLLGRGRHFDFIYLNKSSTKVNYLRAYL